MGRDVELLVRLLPIHPDALQPARDLYARDAQPQAASNGVVPVERKNLQPGDLLYFGSSEKHITHTGPYIGDEKFINATAYQTSAVRIGNLQDPHWTRLLVAIRRVK